MNTEDNLHGHFYDIFEISVDNKKNGIGLCSLHVYAFESQNRKRLQFSNRNYL